MIIEIDGKSTEIDLIEAERDLVKLEGPEPTGKPTPALLDRVLVWLRSVGVVTNSRSVAWQVWWSVFERINCLRVATELQAELAFWFGVDPFNLTPEQAIGLRANLDRVRAQQTLHEGRYRDTDYEAVYQLTLLATGDEKLARKAWAIARERYQDMKTGMA